jgi:hypothetical protein
MRKFALTLLTFALGMTARALTPTTMTSPAPGSTLTSTTVTFTWNAGPAGTTGYGLNVGTTGVGSANLVNIGPLSGTGVTVYFPISSPLIYVRLWTEAAAPSSGVCLSNGTCYSANDYTYLGTAANPLTGLACALTSLTADACTVTLTSAAPTGGSVVTLTSQSSAVTVPASVTVPAGSATASFTATVNPTTVTASSGGVIKTATINLEAATDAYEVGVTIVPPATSPDPVAGYNVLRSSGTGAFQQINASLVTGTAYTDATVTAGDTYQYEIVSVDAAGNKSVPSGAAQIAIP